MLAPVAPEPAPPAPTEPASNTPSPAAADVYLNGAKLTEPDLRELEVRVGERPESGRYWYDAKSGLWGLLGHGPAGLTKPRLRAEPLARDASGGATSVVVNDRELRAAELAALVKLLGWDAAQLDRYAGRYSLDDRGGLYGPGNRYLGNLASLAQHAHAGRSGPDAAECVWLHLGSPSGALGRGATLVCD
jgi:hypothetical protein